MNTGNRGRFSERIKKIVNTKRKNKQDFQDKKNAVRRILLFPLMLLDKELYAKRTGILTDNKVTKYTEVKNNVSLNINKFFRNNNIKREININDVRIINKDNIKSNKKNQAILPDKNVYTNLVDRKNSIDTSKSVESKRNKNTISKNILNVGFVLNKDTKVKKDLPNNEIKKVFLDNNKVNNFAFKSKMKKEKNTDLNSKIVSDISKYLIKSINNLDTIESDLYILSKFDGNRESLDKCREYIAKLHALQNKLEKIRKQFNILKDNIDFDDILEFDDKILLDKLIDFRDSIDNNIAMQTTKNYKLLDEYKYLYTRIDKVVNDAYVLEKEVNDRKTDLEKANINFDEFQRKTYSFDKLEDETIRALERQDKILMDVADKVSNINVVKKVDYIYKGFLDVFLNGMKLVGLYMLSPLKNSIPGIAAATVATKKTMSNLINTMNVEKKIKYIYSATDYSMTLSIAINDLSNLDNLISSTLSDISTIKRELISKFSSYSSTLPKYNNVLNKINKMEKIMINNQIKVRVLSDKMRSKKKSNEETLVKVRKLNSN